MEEPGLGRRDRFAWSYEDAHLLWGEEGGVG